MSEPLSTLQQRNLEDSLNCQIMGREHLILEIFKKSAHTAEGKIQVEMAEVEFLKTRIIGRGKEYAQQLGVIGTIGPGETATEKMRRVFADKLRQAKQKLETLQKSRENQRKKRLDSNLPLFCIIGYTNAGKSSLMNRLTKSAVLTEDKLFATLDTTTREFFIDELKFANMLLHVVDISNPEWRSQIEIVNDTLKEIGVEKPILYVFNKTDKVAPEILETQQNEFLDYQPNIFINTMSKEGVKPLVDFLSKYKI
jgi:GTP-binding protein HflX